MPQRRLQTAALLLTLASALIFLPPLVLLFLSDARLFGVPLGVLYFFLAWTLVIVLSRWLAPRLGTSSPPDHPADRP